MLTAHPVLLFHGYQLIQLALRRGLPTITEPRLLTESGSLLAYGADLTDLYRRVAGYLDKLFKGAKPAELPVEQPTRFDFVINLQTARQLGLTIPRAVLEQATEVIQ